MEEQAQTRERNLLVDYGRGTGPDGDNPEIRLATHLGDLDGPLLRPSKAFILHTEDSVHQLREGTEQERTVLSCSAPADQLGGDGTRTC